MDTTVEAPWRLRRRARRAGRRTGARRLPGLDHPDRDSFISWLQRTIDANAEDAVHHAYEALDSLDQQIAELEGRCRQLELLAKPPAPPDADADPSDHRDHAVAVAKAEATKGDLMGLYAELAKLEAARASIDEAHRAAARSTSETLRALSGPYWAANLEARKDPDLQVPALPQPTIPDVLLNPLPRPRPAALTAGIGA